MFIIDGFSDALERYKKLIFLWFLSTFVLLASNLLLVNSFSVSLVLFFAGAVLLTVSGISCAYVIVKETA